MNKTSAVSQVKFIVQLLISFSGGAFFVEMSYNKPTCREVSPGLDAPRVGWLEVFGKLPATRGASNSGLTEPASMFGFYLMPFR